MSIFDVHPQTPGLSLDFAELAKSGVLQDGTSRIDQLCSSEGPERYGQWGVYVLRNLPDDNPITSAPAFIEDLIVTVGAGLSGGDNQINDYASHTPAGDAQIGFSYRGLAIAVSGDQVRVRVKWTPRPAALRLLTTDSVSSWIAPYAPQHYRVPFACALANIALPNEGLPMIRIPTFAQTMSLARDGFSSVYQAMVMFSVYRDTLTQSAIQGATQQTPGNGLIGIPPNARWCTFYDDVAAPVTSPPQTAYGWFDCWG